MNRKLKALMLACGLMLGIGSASAESFSCIIGKSKKSLELSLNSNEVSYYYGKAGVRPELALTVAIRDVETFAWSGIGRTISYIATLYNGDYSYAIYSATDKHENITTMGVAVDKGQQRLADLQCDLRTVRGDLEKLVLRIKELQ